MEQQYIVNLVTEVDVSKRERVAAEVEQHLGMPRAKVIKLFEQGTGPITKPVAKTVADRVAHAMQSAGVSAESVPHDWQTVLLLDDPEEVDSGVSQEAGFDDSPLEPLIATDTPASSYFETDTDAPTPEPVIDAEAAVKMEAPDDSASEVETPPRVSYVENKDNDEKVLTAEAVTDEPEDKAAPLARPARRPAWLPILVVLAALGLAYLFLPSIFPTSNETNPPAPTRVSEPQSEEERPEATQDDAANNTVADQEPLTDVESSASDTTSEPEAVTETEDGVDSDLEAEPDVAPELQGESELATEPLNDTEIDPITELIASAEEGKFEAQLELAERYAIGDGVEQDYAQSAVWYERAAAAGDEGAQYELGWLYANGLGVERDLEAATRWYEAAAISGNAEAQYQLGFYRYYGQGGDQDFEEARNLFRAAAEQGVAEARFRLGVMYLEGEGGSVDEIEAERWLRLAGEQGVVEAEPYLERLASNNESENDAEPALPTQEVTSDTQSEPVTEAPAAAGAVRLSAGGRSDGLQLLVEAEPLSDIDKAFFDLVKTEDAIAIAEAIRAGANVNARDPYGQTPLMYAASYNGPNAIAELIVDLAEVNAQSAAGWTALMYAARDNPEVVEALLTRGADPTLTNSDGQTALDIAETSNNIAVELLTEAAESTSLPVTEPSETELSGDLN